MLPCLCKVSGDCLLPVTTPEIRSARAVVVAASCVAQGNRLHFAASARRGEEEEEEMFHRHILHGCGCRCGSAAWVPFLGPVTTRRVRNAEPAASCSLDQSLILGAYIQYEKVWSHLSPAVMLVHLVGEGRRALAW